MIDIRYQILGFGSPRSRQNPYPDSEFEDRDQFFDSASPCDQNLPNYKFSYPGSGISQELFLAFGFRVGFRDRNFKSRDCRLGFKIQNQAFRDWYWDPGLKRNQFGTGMGSESRMSTSIPSHEKMQSRGFKISWVFGKKYGIIISKNPQNFQKYEYILFKLTRSIFEIPSHKSDFGGNNWETFGHNDVIGVCKLDQFVQTGEMFAALPR